MEATIEINKKDFEEALLDVKNNLEDLYSILCAHQAEELLKPIESLIHEYEGHLKGSIEELIEKPKEEKD